jgi:hypothetical protein
MISLGGEKQLMVSEKENTIKRYGISRVKSGWVKTKQGA